MAKLTINRILETSRFLATKSGQELADLITYLGDLAEQTIRALRQGLTFEDNVRCQVKTVTMESGVSTLVNTDGKTPIGIWPIKVVSGAEGYGAFSWSIGSDGRLSCEIDLVGGGTKADVTLIILIA